MEDIRIVDFEKYCKTCKHENVDEVMDPCNECLGYPFRDQSEKPEKWEEKGK